MHTEVTGARNSLFHLHYARRVCAEEKGKVYVCACLGWRGCKKERVGGAKTALFEE